MRTTKQLWWKTLTGSVFGFEEGEGGAGEGAGEGQGDGEEGTGEGQGAGEGAGEGDGAGEDTSGLKSALQKEREERKKLERELKTFRKGQQAAEDAEKTEVERLKGENQREATKAAKLAAGFKNNAIETAILKAAGAAKFRDPSDAIRPDIIAAIGVEQDEDDPTQVVIDEATVAAAIKKLAKDKPHWVGTEERRTPKSGSNFGGSGTPPKGDTEKAALQQKYPALRGL
jgi:hypothetical protein